MNIQSDNERVYQFIFSCFIQTVYKRKIIFLIEKNNIDNFGVYIYNPVLALL